MLSEAGYRKGQYFSFDAIIASVIFVMTLILLLSYWNSVRSYLDYQANDLNKEAMRMSNLLFIPPTYATGSTGCSDLERLGLAMNWSDRRMNESLIKCLALDAAGVRASLGSSYNVSIVITDTYTKKSPYTFGDDPALFIDSATEVSKLRRIGTLHTASGEDHMATVDMYVYR